MGNELGLYGRIMFDVGECEEAWLGTKMQIEALSPQSRLE